MMVLSTLLNMIANILIANKIEKVSNDKKNPGTYSSSFPYTSYVTRYNLSHRQRVCNYMTSFDCL